MDKTAAWDKVKERIGRFLHSRVGDHDIAEDLQQEVFLKMAEKLPQLKDNEKLVPWSYQITRNVINDYYRSIKKERNLKNNYVEEAHEIANDKTDRTRELAACLRPMVDVLDEPYRSVLQKVDFEGVSQKTLSEEKGIPYSTVKSHVQRGRQQLRQVLEACCVINYDRYGQIISYHNRSSNCEC